MTNPDAVAYYQQEALWGEHIGASAIDVRDTVLTMIPEAARSILDAGCGNGAITNHLPADRHIEACDISEAALTHVRCRAQIADLTALPYRDGEFDLVLATDVLEHIPEDSYYKALDELYRVSARWLLVAVPYNEILDAATVDCGSCSTSFHVHLHQRSYSAENLARLWEGRAGTVAHAFGGARWRWSSPLVVKLLHLLNGRHYPFEHARCPHCGAAYHPKQSVVAASIERRLESLHYALALAGRIAWPHRSEIVMLFDKTVIASKHSVPAEENRAPPDSLPLQVARDDLSVLTDPSNYARETYLVPGPANTAAMFLPRLPACVRMTPNLPLALYDPLVQRDVPLQPMAEGWHIVPPVSGSRFGYLLRVPETAAPWVSIAFKGELDPWLHESLIGPRDVALQLRIEELSKLNDELEGKRTAGEERIEALLHLCSELEASRDQAEHRVQELLRLANELESKRTAGEERVEALHRLSSELEAGRVQAEHRTENLLKLAEELEGKRAAGEERIEELLRLCAEIEAKRDQAEHRVQELSKLAEELEVRRAAAEERIGQLSASGRSELTKK